MDGWMYGWICACMVVWIYMSMDVCMDGCMVCMFLDYSETSRRISFVIAPYKKPLFCARPLLGFLISAGFEKAQHKTKKAHLYPCWVFLCSWGVRILPGNFQVGDFYVTSIWEFNETSSL